MWDIVLSLIVTHALVWKHNVASSITGIPFLVFILCVTWKLELLPYEMNMYGKIRLDQFSILVILVDLLQCIIHIATHKIYALRQSHALHHKTKHPTARDAFDTGWVDAFTQLMIPLYISFIAVRPNRTTALTFGLLYSHWLVYIHSSLPDHKIRWLVTPSYHKHHHLVSNKNFSHVFAWC